MFALLLALATTDTADTDLLAHYQEGQMLCSNPDAASKTCSNIDSVTRRADGLFFDLAETLIASDKPVTLRLRSEVKFEGSAMCAVLKTGDMEKGTVLANGQPLPPERNASVLARLGKVFQPLVGQKLCEGLRMQGGNLVKVQQAERVDFPLPGKPVQWIKPEDGYRVAPRPA